MSIELLFFLALGGLLAGFTAGLFGIGGGTLIIPLCILLLPKLGALPSALMHQAIGTSLAIIIFTALSASIKQYQLKNLDLVLLKRWIPFVLVGGIAASFVFNVIPSFILALTFMGYLLVYAGYMYFYQSKNYNKHPKEKKISTLSSALAGMFVGALSIFLGIGGGTFTVPFYLKYNYSLKKAIAISSLTGLFIAIYGSLSVIYTGYHTPGLARYSLGYVNIPSVLIIAPFSMITATLGVKVNNYLREQTLNNLYVIFLLSIFGFMYVNVFVKQLS